MFDNKLKGAKPVIISNEFEAKKYQFEHVIYTINRKVILVGRTYDMKKVKGRKRSSWTLTTTKSVYIMKTANRNQRSIPLLKVNG